MDKKEANALIRETSPYLLQHAYNPVHWVAWNDASLTEARESDTLILISIGYAACHWCHVMERECFEDSEVAELMNTRYIPIKVDREERPDVDHIYMDALQIMTGSGGWPLNIVALPDGKPVWGATYLPKQQWMEALAHLARIYREEPEKVREYAEDLTTAVRNVHSGTPQGDTGIPGPEVLQAWISSWKGRFDHEYGGTRGAPKFMMPVRLEWLMHWGEASGDPEIRDHVTTSLTRMAYGGLFDQLGGGFSRYSVDARWHVPHFEKMLYDNAQLLSLYARAYACYRDPLYREIVAVTVGFVERELSAAGGGYCASLDADSPDAAGKAVEGAYYVWTESELKGLLGDDFELFAEAYSVNAFGHWEDGHYVLIRREGDQELGRRLGIDLAELQARLAKCREILFERRDTRSRPGLDDKVITSWNGLLLKGLADAARYCGLETAGVAATRLATFLCGTLTAEDGMLPHTSKSGMAQVPGFLEDYAAVMDGYLALYQLDGDSRWVTEARKLCTYVLANFSQDDRALLNFSSGTVAPLIRQTVETADNVIPASNSIMAGNLFRLGLFYGETAWLERSRAMLSEVSEAMATYSGQHCNWLQLALWLKQDFLEVVVAGPEAERKSRTLRQAYLPHCFLAVSEQDSDLPLFEGRYREDATRYFICREGMCQAPMETEQNALESLKLALKLLN